MAEAPVELVWNKGIARLCDRRIPDEFPNGLTYRPVSTLAGARTSPDLPADVIVDPARYGEIRDGEIVWVRLSWLQAFARQVLPLIRARFVLATGDSTAACPRISRPSSRGRFSPRPRSFAGSPRTMTALCPSG